VSTSASNEISKVAGEGESLGARSWDRAHPDGCDAIELVELVAITIGGDPADRCTRARELLDSLDLIALSRATSAHLARAFDLPMESALRLAAAFALGRRVESHARRPRTAVSSPARMHEILAGEMRGLGVETFFVLLLDGKHRLLRRHRASQGTLTSSLVHPREVFGPALREGAAAVAVAHNHPSGDPEPSSEDLAVTRRLIEAGRLVGVPLLDHLVIADAGYVSIRERINFESV
jgi:DNA repair protein RadC